MESQSQLKYRILGILCEMPPSVRRAKRKEMRLKLGHKPIMFSRYLNATFDQTLDFSGLELPTIANVLNVNVSELFTKVVVMEPTEKE